MSELILALLTWIVAETGLLMPPPPPVVLVSEKQISELAYGRGWIPSDNVRALYNRDAAIIYLRNDWKSAELLSRATLLHELVHHVQAFNRVEYECPANREPLAYDLTIRWLREQGVEDPYALLNTDEFTIILLSICRDSG